MGMVRGKKENLKAILELDNNIVFYVDKSILWLNLQLV